MKIEKILKTLFWLSFISVIVGMLLTNQLSPWQLVNSSMLPWLKAIGNIGKLVFMLVLVFRGVYLLRKNGISKPYVAELLIGLGLLIIHLSLLAYAIKKIENTLVYDYNPAKISIEEIINSKLSALEKSSISKNIAKNKFYFNGEITKYFNTEGDIVNYDPSQTEIRESTERKEKINSIREVTSKLKFSFMSYIALLILTILLSYILAVHNKSLKHQSPRSLDSL